MVLRMCACANGCGRITATETVSNSDRACSGHNGAKGTLTLVSFFFFQAEDGIRDTSVTGVQTCALPIYQLFNSSEQRLARTLLLLANYGKEGTPETVVPKINQETLAGMVGTTRPRVSFFRSEERRVGKEWIFGSVSE